jgi:beta-glucanase (GH16 family)
VKRILFEDDFNSNTLAPVWRLRGVEANSVGAESSARMVSVSDSQLHLRVVPVAAKSFLHASIATGEVRQPCDFIISRGYVEARVKFNSFHGAHGAVWLAPATDYEPGQAELDFGEYFGAHSPNRKSGTKVLQNVYHRLPGQNAGEFTEMKYDFNSNDLGHRWDDWNTYKVRIQEDKFTFYINGKITAVAEGDFPILPKFLCISLLTKFDFEVEALTQHNHELPTMAVDWIRAWDYGN